MISPKGHKIYCALHFRFQTLNKEAKYEALIAGLHLVREIQACNLRIYNDSQLVVNQVNYIYLVRGERMTVYLEKAKELIGTFPVALIEVIP